MDEPEKLLACPFCGSAAEYGDRGDGGRFIQCTGSLCMASSKLVCPMKEAAEPHLREVWNNRAGAPGHGATERSRLAPASLLECVELAIRANGGEEWHQEWCRCDPDVGAVPCEYCAIYTALNKTVQMLRDQHSNIGLDG